MSRPLRTCEQAHSTRLQRSRTGLDCWLFLGRRCVAARHSRYFGNLLLHDLLALSFLAAVHHHNTSATLCTVAAWFGQGVRASCLPPRHPPCASCASSFSSPPPALRRPPAQVRSTSLVLRSNRRHGGHASRPRVHARCMPRQNSAVGGGTTTGSTVGFL